MGVYITDTNTADVLFQLNNRFAPGPALEEMVTIQQEFRVFSEDYTLKQAFRALHIVPGDFTERRFWFVFLEALKNYISDVDGVSGHDRIINAYRENLESDHPLPVHTTTHKLSDDRRILVSRGQPIIYDAQEYLIISIPTKPAAVSLAARSRAAQAARQAAAARQPGAGEKEK
jgi:hypothetical protein